MLKLRNEGPLKAAPQLTDIVQEVSDEIQSWAGIISAHWKLGDPTCVDGAEFHVADVGEFGHIHLNGEVHILLTEQLRGRLLEHKLAKPFLGQELGHGRHHHAGQGRSGKMSLQTGL